MTAPAFPARNTGPAIDQAEQDALDRYGIRRELRAHYEVDGYRYTKLSDAIAQARRTRGA
jgi:hypothetical protein